MTSTGVKDKKIHELEMKLQQHTQPSSEPSIQGQKLADLTPDEHGAKMDRLEKLHAAKMHKLENFLDLMQDFQVAED